MAVTVTTFTPNALKSSVMEVHNILWTSTTATVEVTTGLTEIYAAWFNPMFGADAGHANGTAAALELDETLTAGIITVSGGAVTVNRLEIDDATALTGQSTQLILVGKS